MKEIWEDREQKSFISGIHIPRFSPGHMAHVLPKGKYPEKKYDPDNIVLLTLEEHRLFDQGTEHQRKMYADKMEKYGVEVNWDKLFALKGKLR